MLRYLFSLIFIWFAVSESFLDIPTCKVAQHALVITYFTTDILKFIQESIFRDQDQIRELLNQISMTALLMLIPIFPINYYKSPECMSPNFRLLMFMYFMPLLFVMIVVVLFGFGYLIYFVGIRMYRAYVEKNLTEKIVSMLRSSLSEPEKLQALYAQHSSQLEYLPLLPEELAFFKDNFETDFAHVMNKFDSKECLICFEEFAPDTRIVTFPRCQHLYHYNCLQEWLKKKKACALCKEDFRMNFAMGLKEKAEKSFLKRGPDFDSLKDKRQGIDHQNKTAG